MKIEDNICKDFGLIVRNARKEKGSNWNQTRLSKEINLRIEKFGEKNFDQKKVSRLERGDNSLKLTERVILAIKDIFEFPDEIINPIIQELKDSSEVSRSKKLLVFAKESGQLITTSTDSVLVPYLGTYYCLFYSTDSTKKKPIHGVLEISFDENYNSQCVASLRLMEGNKVIKRYNGPIIINIHYRSWYCILVGEEKQEICMMISSHFNSTIHKNLLNVALVLTTSAGIQKRPTMHRMLISRNKLSGERLKLALSQLRLNTDTIVISEDALNKLKKDVTKKLDKLTNKSSISKYKILLESIDVIQNLGKKEIYYKIDESILYDSNLIIADEKMRSYVVSSIRSYTDNEYYNKVSQTVHNICTDIVGGRK